jgi:tetratricopeptide (TPR) repeat protein
MRVRKWQVVVAAILLAVGVTAVLWFLTKPPDRVLTALIGLASGLVFFLFSLLLGHRGTVRLAPEQEARIVRETVRQTVAGVTAYLDGLPGVKNPAIKDPFDAGMKLMDASKWDEAIVEFRKALPHAKASQLVALYNLIGLCYTTPGKLDSALASYEKSLSVARESNDQQGAAIALGNIGLIYHDKGDLDQALKYQQDALKTDREIGYRQGEAQDLGNIGLIYQDKGDLDRALKHHQQALRIHQEIGYQQGVADQLGNIGLIYKTKGDLDQALKYHEQALKIDREIGYQQGVATALGNIGAIYQVRGDLDRALKYHEDNLKVAREIGYRQSEASALGNIGLIYQAKGDLDQALKCYLQSLHIFTQIGVAYGPDIVMGYLAGLSRQMGLESFLSACEKHGMGRSEAEKLVARLPPPKP